MHNRHWYLRTRIFRASTECHLLVAVTIETANTLLEPGWTMPGWKSTETLGKISHVGSSVVTWFGRFMRGSTVCCYLKFWSLGLIWILLVASLGFGANFGVTITIRGSGELSMSFFSSGKVTRSKIRITNCLFFLGNCSCFLPPLLALTHLEVTYTSMGDKYNNERGSELNKSRGLRGTQTLFSIKNLKKYTTMKYFFFFINILVLLKRLIFPFTPLSCRNNVISLLKLFIFVIPWGIMIFLVFIPNLLTVKYVTEWNQRLYGVSESEDERAFDRLGTRDRALSPLLLFVGKREMLHMYMNAIFNHVMRAVLTKPQTALFILPSCLLLPIFCSVSCPPHASSVLAILSPSIRPVSRFGTRHLTGARIEGREMLFRARILFVAQSWGENQASREELCIYFLQFYLVQTSQQQCAKSS